MSISLLKSILYKQNALEQYVLIPEIIVIDIPAFSEIQNPYSFHLLSFSQTPKSLVLSGKGDGVFLTIQLSTIMQMKKVGDTTPMLSVPSLHHLN